MNNLMTLDRPDVYWDFQLDLESDNRTHVLTRFETYLNNINFVLDNMDKEMSDDQYLELLGKIFYINLSREDEIKILSKYYGKDFHRSAVIKTSMFKKKENYNPKHKVFRDDVNIEFDVIYTPNIQVYSFNHYTVSWIEEALQKGDMIIVSESEKEMLSSNQLSMEEEYHEFPKVILGDMLDKNNIYYKDACAYMRQRFPKMFLAHYLKTYISLLQKSYDYILLQMEHDNDYESACATDINEKLEQSGLSLKLKSLFDKKLK